MATNGGVGVYIKDCGQRNSRFGVTGKVWVVKRNESFSSGWRTADGGLSLKTIWIMCLYRIM